MADTISKLQPPESKRSEFMKPRRRTAMGALMSFAVLIIAIIFVMSVFFRVSDIRVEGNEHYTDREIIEAIDIEEGDNLFFFDRFAASSNIYAKLPYIDTLSVERALPNRVTIRVEESKALAYVLIGDERWTLDKKCKVLGKATDLEAEELIPIVGLKPGTLMIGETFDCSDHNTARVAYLSEVLTQMQDRQLAPMCSKIDFSDGGDVWFNYGGKYKVMIGGSSDTERKFGMFVTVMDKLLSGDVGTIDVSDGRTAHFTPT